MLERGRARIGSVLPPEPSGIPSTLGNPIPEIPDLSLRGFPARCSHPRALRVGARHGRSSPFLIPIPIPPPHGAERGSQRGLRAHLPLLSHRCEPLPARQSPNPGTGALLTPTSACLCPEGRGRGAKPPTAQLWAPEIAPGSGSAPLNPLLGPSCAGPARIAAQSFVLCRPGAAPGGFSPLRTLREQIHPCCSSPPQPGSV